MSKVTLTKAVLARYLEDHIGIEAEMALSIVENFFEEIIQALEKEETVKLVGLGEFAVRQKKARPGRNPKTGDNIPVSSRRVVVFRTSPSLRKILNQLSLQEN